MTWFDPVLHCFAPKNDDELKIKDNTKLKNWDNTKSYNDLKNEDQQKIKTTPK